MQSIKAKAYYLLGRRPYFSRELSQKLKEKGYPQAEVEELMQQLEKRGFLNDKKLAASFVNSQKKKGYGPAVIAYKLRQKAGEIDIELSEDEEELYSYIKRRHFKDLPEKKDKVIRSLMRKGHSYSLINKVLETITQRDA